MKLGFLLYVLIVYAVIIIGAVIATSQIKTPIGIGACVSVFVILFYAYKNRNMNIW